MPKNISIGEVRHILTKDSQSYRILSLIALSGECSEGAVALLLPQESYRQKVIHKLLDDKFLSRYQNDDVKGYRLMRRGKEALLQIDREKFSFYLEDGADFSMRRTKLSHRQRQHRISEVLAMMENAGIEIHRGRKYPIFERDPPQSEAVLQSEAIVQSGAVVQSAFYHSKEVKAQTDLTRKIISSKMAGERSGEQGACKLRGKGHS